MKSKGLIFSIIVIFSLSLYLAYHQIVLYSDVTSVKESLLQASVNLGTLTGFKADFLNFFSGLINGLTPLLAESLIAATIALALLVEVITLYPAVQIQLKQKKIHLFHKKLVDHFQNGELSMGKAKRELDILYAVNEAIHKKGGTLFLFQLLIFVAVLVGFHLLSFRPDLLSASFDAVNYALLARPLNIYLPMLVALGYLLHSLIKISVKQKEDYISPAQINVALTFAVLISLVIFFFAGSFSTLLSVYLLTHIAFASMRYLIVEEHASEWGKLAQKELIKMLRDTTLQKNKIKRASQKFNHLSPVRHINLHLLEEGISMSFAFVIALNGLQLM